MMSSELTASAAWNPYQTNTTKTSSSNLGYSTSSSPLDNSTSSSSSGGTNSSTCSSSDAKLNPSLDVRSISSLIPTPGYEDDESQARNSVNQQTGQQQGGTSSDGSSSNISSDLSSLSASNSPPYRSPPSSSYLSASSSLYAAAAAAAATHSNYGLYATGNHHPYVPQPQGYHGFGGFDFNNPYYTSPNLSNIQEQLKLTPFIKPEISYSGQRYGGQPIKSESDDRSKPTSPSESSNDPNANNVSPLGHHLVNQPHLNQHHPHQYPTLGNSIAYYNNVGLTPSVPATPPYGSHHHHLMPGPGSYPNMTLSVDSSSSSPPTVNAFQPSNQSTGPRKTNEPTYSNHLASTPNYGAGSSSSSSSGLAANNNNCVKAPFKIKLAELSLWKQFHQIGTEMIITKSGRRMFPPLKVNISGLENSKKYHMLVDMLPADDNRYKYHNGEWQITGKAEAHFNGRAYCHPDSPMTGSQWMKQIISFHKLKLTNYHYDKSNIILNSMHKYVPRLTIFEEETNSFFTHTINEAQFMAVTAYQNEAITKLKIEHNPFAKGFRDGQSRKAKRTSDDENESLEERHFNQMVVDRQTQPNKMNRVQSSEGLGMNPLVAKDMNKYDPALQHQPSMHQDLHHHHLNYQYNQHLHHLNHLQMNSMGYPNKFNTGATPKTEHLNTDGVLYSC